MMAEHLGSPHPGEERQRYSLLRNEPARRPVFSPTVDIHESDSELTLAVDLPGVRRDGIDVTVENNVLRISAEGMPAVAPVGTWVYREYRAGDYFRSFILSDEFDIDHIRAELDDGVLTVRLPKTSSRTRRHIEVH